MVCLDTSSVIPPILKPIIAELSAVLVATYWEPIICRLSPGLYTNVMYCSFVDFMNNAWFQQMWSSLTTHTVGLAPKRCTIPFECYLPLKSHAPRARPFSQIQRKTSSLIVMRIKRQALWCRYWTPQASTLQLLQTVQRNFNFRQHF